MHLNRYSCAFISQHAASLIKYDLVANAHKIHLNISDPKRRCFNSIIHHQLEKEFPREVYHDISENQCNPTFSRSKNLVASCWKKWPMTSSFLLTMISVR